MSETVAQMLSAIEDVTTQIELVSSSSRKASAAPQNGIQIVHQTIQGMDQVRSTVLHAAERIRELGRQSDQIGQITSVITGIAEQTNPLALNAATEQMTVGSVQVHHAIVDIVHVTEENAAVAEEVASSVEEINATMEEVASSALNLSELAKALHKQVYRFKV